MKPQYRRKQETPEAGGVAASSHTYTKTSCSRYEVNEEDLPLLISNQPSITVASLSPPP